MQHNNETEQTMTLQPHEQPITQCQLCTILIGGQYTYFDELRRVYITRQRVEQQYYIWDNYTLCGDCYNRVMAVKMSKQRNKWQITHRFKMEMEDNAPYVKRKWRLPKQGKKPAK